MQVHMLDQLQAQLLAEVQASDNQEHVEASDAGRSVTTVVIIV